MERWWIPWDVPEEVALLSSRPGMVGKNGRDVCMDVYVCIYIYVFVYFLLVKQSCMFVPHRNLNDRRFCCCRSSWTMWRMNPTMEWMMVSVVFVSYWCLFPLARLCCETTLPRCGAGEDEVQQGRKKDRKIDRERESAI